MTQGVATVAPASAPGAANARGSSAPREPSVQPGAQSFLALLSPAPAPVGMVGRKPGSAAQSEGQSKATKAGSDSTALSQQIETLLAMLLKLIPAQAHAQLTAVLGSGAEPGKGLPSGGSPLPAGKGGANAKLLQLLKQIESELSQSHLKEARASSSVRSQPTPHGKLDAAILDVLKFTKDLPTQNAKAAERLLSKILTTRQNAAQAGTSDSPGVQKLIKSLLMPSHAENKQSLSPRPVSATGASAVNSAPQPGVRQSAQTTLPPPALQGSHVAEDFAQHVQWMVQSGQQFARVSVSPAQLGPIEIHIAVDGNQAQVAFGTHHEAAREVLQSALPKLRQILDAGGLNLVHADVSGQGGGAGQQQSSGGAFTFASFAAQPSGFGGSVQTAPPPRGLHTLTGIGLVDDYA